MEPEKKPRKYAHPQNSRVITTRINPRANSKAISTKLSTESSKIPAKPPTKTIAKPTAKPPAKPTAKPPAKPPAKPTAKPPAKPIAKPTAKPPAKPTAKPKIRSPVRPPIRLANTLQKNNDLPNPEHMDPAPNEIENEQKEILNEPIKQDNDLPVIKKRPGRPKKMIVNVPVEIRGVVDVPANDENILEIVYQNPKIFKKIFSLDKSYVVNEICMDFAPNKFIITSQNHTGTVSKRCTFHCDRLNHFYCNEVIDVDIKREMLEKIFRNLDKPHYKITFLLKDDFRSILHLNIKDYELDCEHQYGIEVIQKVQRPNEEQYDIADYPITFELPSKSFKRIINDFDAQSDVLTIRKNGLEPLQLTYEMAKKVTLSALYSNSDKINLKSTIEDGDLLSVSIDISNIKPFSNASIGETVYIAVDKIKPMCFMTKLDKVKIEKPDGLIEDGFVCDIMVLADIKKF